ncbi:MAG: DUF3667 domain-containing protein [Flavobacterium sp.]|uniref:DUF3667 domain-containing protein n=1 Tax=Flavobacterium sp. TaxID=239 RepID=UPI0012091490|nr:DUF3667 domain-containing protein [Flavobacterium sp.]RZJ68531.1 MAG: DUF3667 domain-containing protein [Flavobacterium sp.]
MHTNCRNCETTLVAEYEFCPGCGQKADLHRLGLHELVHDGIHYFTHADKGLFQLVRDLVAKRGIVAKEYIEGKRRKYFPPLNFFLIIAAIFVFTATFKQSQLPIDVYEKHPELRDETDPATKTRLEKIYTRAEKANRFTNSYSNLIAMAALPLSAFIYFLFYKKAKYNYIEHVVAGMYLLGFCLLIYALILIPIAYLLGISRLYMVAVLMFLQLFYGATFYVGFLGKSGAANYFKAFGVSLVSLLVWIVGSSFTVRLYITNGFWGILP